MHARAQEEEEERRRRRRRAGRCRERTLLTEIVLGDVSSMVDFLRSSLTGSLRSWAGSDPGASVDRVHRWL
jgi:hypothetical protein